MKLLDRWEEKCLKNIYETIDKENLTELSDITNGIKSVHRIGRRKGDSQDILLVLNNKATKKNLYNNRRKFNRIRLKPYLTKQMRHTLEACQRFIDKDTEDNKHIGEFGNYVFADVEGNLKFCLHDPYRGKSFFTFRTVEDFINKVEQSIVYKRDDFFDRCEKYFTYN